MILFHWFGDAFWFVRTIMKGTFCTISRIITLLLVRVITSVAITEIRQDLTVITITLI